MRELGGSAEGGLRTGVAELPTAAIGAERLLRLRRIGTTNQENKSNPQKLPTEPHCEFPPRADISASERRDPLTFFAQRAKITDRCPRKRRVLLGSRPLSDRIDPRVQSLSYRYRPTAALTLVVLIGLAFVPRSAHAGGFTVTVFGSRRTGSMTNLGSADDLTAIFHNAAGLAQQKGRRVHLSSSLTFLSLDFELRGLDPQRFVGINSPGCQQRGDCAWPLNSEGYYQRRIEPERTFGVLPFVGVSGDLAPLSPRLRDIVVGLAVYAPNVYGAFLPQDAPSSYHIIEGTFAVLATTLAVGWQAHPKLALGASLSYHFMRITVGQRLSLIDALTPDGQTPTPIATAGQNLLGDLRLDYLGIDHGLGWALSALYRPTRWLSLGVAYNGATPARFRGDLRFAALGDLVKGNPDALNAALSSFDMKLPTRLELEMPIPHALGIGVALRPTHWLEVSVDYRLWFYTAFERQVLRPLYNADQPGEEPLSEADLSRDKHYQLSYEIGAGVLLRPFARYPQIELLSGISYDKSPIPDSTFTLDNPSLSLVQFGFGLRWHPQRGMRLAATYMLFLGRRREINDSQTSPPTNGRGGGTTHMPGVEFEYAF
ncbi:MAG: outer membrane protein transport protein [Deltaproteobacteria bacterium]|nr:outer membrane protein transport protein [Deltaproteobacteria bacterium]